MHDKKVHVLNGQLGASRGLQRCIIVGVGQAIYPFILKISSKNEGKIMNVSISTSQAQPSSLHPENEQDLSRRHAEDKAFIEKLKQEKAKLEAVIAKLEADNKTTKSRAAYTLHFINS